MSHFSDLISEAFYIAVEMCQQCECYTKYNTQVWYCVAHLVKELVINNF